MRPSARPVLNDMSTRLRTSLQLVGAIARTARRHKELLLFPVLSLLATAALLLAIAAVGPVLIVHAGELPTIG